MGVSGELSITSVRAHMARRLAEGREDPHVIIVLPQLS